MEVYYMVVVFIFGLLLGSFYNVVGYRLPKGLSIVKPGSFCPKCNHSLKWYELIPVFSFLIQKGRCRNCKCKISYFYPVIELLTGFLFLLSYIVFSFSPEFLISILISSFFVIVLVCDLQYLVIPDEVTFFFSFLLLVVKLIYFGLPSFGRALLYGLFLFSVMYILMLVGNMLFKKESLGGGDIKLMFFVGTILNPIEGLFSIFLASLIAFPVSLFIYFKKKNKVIPFGPFLLFSALLIFLFKIDAFSIINTIFS